MAFFAVSLWLAVATGELRRYNVIQLGSATHQWLISRSGGQDMAFMDETRENAENKVLLLFFADRVRMPVSSMQLTRIMLEHRFMNYFHMQQCLHELASNGFLSCEERVGTDHYSITPEGIRILGLFGGLIPEGIRNRLQKGITEIRAGLLREMAVTAESVLHSEDEYRVTLRVSDTDEPLFEATLSVGAREDARAICQNWRTHADELYPKLISLLLDQPIDSEREDFEGLNEADQTPET